MEPEPNWTPEVREKFFKAALEDYYLRLPELKGQYPNKVEEFALRQEHPDSLPKWALPILAPGFKVERHVFADGSVIVKLVTERGLVLLARKPMTA